MPHIALPRRLPGITAAFAFRPETAKPIRARAQILLRGPVKALLAIAGKVEESGRSGRPGN